MKFKLYQIVFLLIFPLFSYAQWSDNSEVNKLLSADLNKSTLAKIAVCPDGNYYVSWNYDDNLNFNTYLHYYDKNGYQLWEQPLLISDNETRTWITDYSLSVDEDNCAIISFQDIRNYGKSPTDESDVFVYKINQYGQFLWSEDGIKVTPGIGSFTASPKICITDEGNYIVAWSAAEISFRDSIPERCQVYVNKLDKDGNTLWENPIVLVDTLWQYIFPEIIPTDDDGFILTWMQYKDKSRFGALAWRYIYAQKYDSDGNPVWEKDVAVFDELGIPPNTFLIPEAKTDGYGGAIFVWRIGQGFSINIRAQHLSSEGIEMWEHNGIKVCIDDEINQDYPSFAYNPTNKNLFVFWITDYYDGVEMLYYIGLYGNLLNQEGERIWGENGKEFVAPVSALEPFPQLQNVRLGNDNALVLYSMSNKQSSQDNRYDTLRAALINEEGEYVWDSDYIDVCSNPSFKMFISLSEFSMEQWVAIWGDSRNTLINYNQDIYGQNINFDGTIGIGETSVDEDFTSDFILSPNPASDNIEISGFINPRVNPWVDTDRVVINIYNTLGELVLTVETLHATSIRRIDLSHLPIGLYYIKIGNYFEKFVVVR